MSQFNLPHGNAQVRVIISATTVTVADRKR